MRVLLRSFPWPLTPASESRRTRGCSSGPGSSRTRDHFASLTDRRRREVVYPLIDIVTIALCAVIAGADNFVAIAELARKKRTWLSQFLDLSRGVTSHDRFNAILAAIKPDEFEECLLIWTAAPHEVRSIPVVTTDGKTLRRSYDKASGESAIHMVGAWTMANSISLRQVAVDAKGNEITAVPRPLMVQACFCNSSA